MVLCWGWGLWPECVSAFPTYFKVDIFSFTFYVGVTQLVNGVLSVGIALCVAVHLVFPWEEGHSGVSYVTILVFSLQFCSFNLSTLESLMCSVHLLLAYMFYLVLLVFEADKL